MQVARREFGPLFLALLTLVSGGQAVAQPPLNIVHPLPPSPPWLEGYQLRWPVRVLGEAGKQEAQSVIVSLPTGGWLRPDASDLVVQAANGQLLPALVRSHDPAGETIVQFKRSGNEPWYWVYGANPKAAPGPKVDPQADAAFREGIVLEVRAWTGQELSDWVKVRAGLEKSEQVLANAIVTEMVQNCNPARPAEPQNFAASYRGHFTIKKDGTYRFVVNADDAAFLFIDGFKVFERPGRNTPLGAVKVKELDKLAGKVDLKAGTHAFEVHHVVGANPQARGTCALLWSTPEQPKFAFLPPTACVDPLYARVAATERPNGSLAPSFVHGVDDTLEATGLKLLLVRFEAQGPDDRFDWDFGDGTTGSGRSVVHVYFQEGDHEVTLQAGSGMPPYRRRVNVWAEPGETSPLSLALAVEALEAMPWQKLDSARLRQMYTFLAACAEPTRWALLDKVAQHLLAQKDLDLDTRAHLVASRLEALTQLGRAAEALKLAEVVKGDFAKTPALQVRLLLEVAALHQYHYKDAAAASKIYKAILDEHGRTEHPNLRLAAVRWGDLCAESGDLARASEIYRVAGTLGGEKLMGGAVTDASTRGALLRIAEQKLKEKDMPAARQLLEKLDLEYPGRRLDGFYCFLRAELDRHSGHYDEALRHYEMIFKLPQWAGYRDRAAFGIADCYQRQGELEKALRWFGELKEAHPRFAEERKVSETEKLLRERLERVKAAAARGSAETAFFKGYETGFEEDEPTSFGKHAGCAVVQAPGMKGPGAVLLDTYPRDLNGYDLVFPLTGLAPEGWYWVEFWYRDELWPWPPAGTGPHLHLYLNGQTAAKPVTTLRYNFDRNAFHRWHKVGLKIKAPPAQDCELLVRYVQITGAMLIDRLSIRPVTDRQIDALTSFYEGSTRSP
jgi:tetratricopeptide (TPR) repeat protein